VNETFHLKEYEVFAQDRIFDKIRSGLPSQDLSDLKISNELFRSHFVECSEYGLDYRFRKYGDNIPLVMSSHCDKCTKELDRIQHSMTSSCKILETKLKNHNSMSLCEVPFFETNRNKIKPEQRLVFYGKHNNKLPIDKIHYIKFSHHVQIKTPKMKPFTITNTQQEILAEFSTAKWTERPIQDEKVTMKITPQHNPTPRGRLVSKSSSSGSSSSAVVTVEKVDNEESLFESCTPTQTSRLTSTNCPPSPILLTSSVDLQVNTYLFNYLALH
jgi:hypothetical protein